MYTSTYSSSSPVRTYAPRINSTTQQQQQQQSFYPSSSTNLYSTSNSQAMDDYTTSSRRMPTTTNYSNANSASIPIRTTTPSRKYTSNTNNVSADPSSTRYPSNAYSSSYRGTQVENFFHRTNGTRYEGSGVNANERAHSYDDLLHEQHRSQPSIYNSNTRLASHQAPTHGRRETYNDHDDDLIVKSTDLSANQEQEMLELVRVAFRKYELSNQRELAGFLKRAADKTFAACWHCIVGRQFSSYVTHEMNGFIYLTKGPLSILLFKSGS